jgi:hypothetical protein
MANPGQQVSAVVYEKARDQHYKIPDERSILESIATILSAVAATRYCGVRWGYRSYGFLQFPDPKDKLFLPMQTIRAMFARQQRGRVSGG